MLPARNCEDRESRWGGQGLWKKRWVPDGLWVQDSAPLRNSQPANSWGLTLGCFFSAGRTKLLLLVLTVLGPAASQRVFFEEEWRASRGGAQ